MLEWGIFVTIGKVDALLHVSKVSYNSADLKQIFNIGEEIEVLIDNIQDARIELDRLSVIKRKAELHKYKNNQKVRGTIYRIDQRHGVYLELENGALGFLRKSSYCFNNKPISIADYYSVGEKIECTVINYDKKEGGYSLSVLKNITIEDILKKASINTSHPAKLIKVGDLKWQISQRFKHEIEWDTFETPPCPRCQKEAYLNKSIKIVSSLEISANGTKWKCRNCEYHHRTIIIFKFLNIPLTGYCYIDSEVIDQYIKNSIGTDVDVVVKQIIDKKYFIAEIKNINHFAKSFSPIESRKHNTKQISAELGFIYEQIGSFTESSKEPFLNLCMYYFGLAKMSRSYFHSFFSNFALFIKDLLPASHNNIASIHINAKILFDAFSSEELAIKTFPDLNNILNSLYILSNMKCGDIIASKDLLDFISNSDINQNLNELANLVVAYNCTKNQHISDDIIETIKIKLRNNLNVLQEDRLDEENNLLRKKYLM